MGRVEVFRTGDQVTVYDSETSLEGGAIAQAWKLPEWSGLLSAIKTKAAHPAVTVLPTREVWLGFRRAGRHKILYFTAAEWSAFVAGVRAGEFDIDRLPGPAASEGVGAGRTGPVVSGLSEAATGAGPSLRPAPVAAVLGPSPVKPRPMSGASSGHDAGLLTDGESVLPGAAHTHFSGPNVAAMYVPAGQPSPIPHRVASTAQAGQPGLASDKAVAAAAAAICGYPICTEMCVRCTSLARDALAAALPFLSLEPAPQWGSGPLVHHVDEPVRCGCKMCCSLRETYEASRSDADSEPGGVPTHVGAAIGGWKAGPGLTAVSPGPAEPAGGAA